MALNCVMGLQNVYRMALTLAFYLDEIIIKSFYDLVDLIQVEGKFPSKPNQVSKFNTSTKFQNVYTQIKTLKDIPTNQKVIGVYGDIYDSGNICDIVNFGQFQLAY